MSDSKIIEDLLDENPIAWETANLLREHYGEIVHRRGKSHFEQLVQDLPVALHNSIGGEWTVWLAGPLDKRQGYPLRIRNINWPSANSFVIGFEYKKDDFRGDACFGLIHNDVPVLKRDERLNRYPDQPSTVAPGFKESNYWLAEKIITKASAPEFVSKEMFVKLTKLLVKHYDTATEQHDKGWLSSLDRFDENVNRSV